MIQVPKVSKNQHVPIKRNSRSTFESHCCATCWPHWCLFGCDNYGRTVPVRNNWACLVVFPFYGDVIPPEGLFEKRSCKQSFLPVVNSLGKILATMPMFLCPALWSAHASSTRLDRGWVCVATRRCWRMLVLVGYRRRGFRYRWLKEGAGLLVSPLFLRKRYGN